MKLAWITDPHLEWLSTRELKMFRVELEAAPADAFMISGDISIYSKLGEHLQWLNQIGLPIYFVLGNHDFYGTSFEHLRSKISILLRELKNLYWLTEEPEIKLSDQTWLVGHDGWACGTAGIGARSDIELNDYHVITDFLGQSRGVRFDLMKKAAMRSSTALSRKLRRIKSTGAQHVILVTHAPPFEEACRYHGGSTDPEFLPHFCNKIMGNMLLKEVQNFDGNVSVFCGHTHDAAYYTAAQYRITVKVGDAVYGSPIIQEIVDVDMGT